jgi:hypothetical protein
LTKNHEFDKKSIFFFFTKAKSPVMLSKVSTSSGKIFENFGENKKLVDRHVGMKI